MVRSHGWNYSYLLLLREGYGGVKNYLGLSKGPASPCSRPPAARGEEAPGLRRRPPGGKAQGFGLLEVLVATTIMGLVMVVLLEVLSAAVRAQESSWGNTQAELAAEKVLQENCLLNRLAAGTYQGREGTYDYVVRITPQFSISSPMRSARLLCSAIQVTVSWQERGRAKSLVLGTIRTNTEKKS